MNVDVPPTETQIQVLVPRKVWDDQCGQLAGIRARLEQLNLALELAGQTSDLERFVAFAMALCNLLASRFKAGRVSIGMLRGNFVQLVAMSQTEKIVRKMRLVRDIEEAMEECLDQDVDILVPVTGNVITRAASHLIAAHGSGSMLAMPLRRRGPRAVLLLEFENGRSAAAVDIAALRAAADLLTPRLLDLYRYDRWFGARWLYNWRSSLAKLLGPSHTWIKAAAIGVTGFLAWACFARGTFYITAGFTLEPVRQAQIIAPFNGYIKRVFVRPGDNVIANRTELIQLHTSRLRDQLAAAQAQKAAYSKQAQVADARGKIADMQIADESMNIAAAKIRLLRRQIAYAAITSPVSGVVLSGNLRRRIGEAVHLGDVLMRVAPIAPLNARVNILESDILYLKNGQTGSLATASYPSDRIPISVVYIDPLAIVRHKQNVFRVRVVIRHPPAWLRPGMQGTARINAGRRRYIWIWTRGLINWIRMKFWL